MSKVSTDPQALGGIRVVELATSITGAQVGQFFSDFGAEVVLVEPPGGSRLRRQPAFPMWARLPVSSSDWSPAGGERELR